MIAACFAAPAVSVVKGQTDLASMQDRAYRFGKTGILTGLVLGMSCIGFFRLIFHPLEQLVCL
jgi:hypothetical protein